MQVILDCRRLADKSSAHDYLQEKLPLPDWYGRNLDALYDCLTAECPPMEIVLTHHQGLNGYAQAVWDTLLEAADERTELVIRLPDEEDLEESNGLG